MKNKFRAFTLLEMLVVIIIIAILAAFALPNFTNSRRRAIERQAIANLYIIREAMNIYLANQNTIPDCGDSDRWNTLDKVNEGLDLGIIDSSGMTYKCFGAANGPSNGDCINPSDPETNVCYAYFGDGDPADDVSFNLHFHYKTSGGMVVDDGSSVHCSNKAAWNKCPTCDNGGCDYMNPN